MWLTPLFDFWQWGFFLPVEKIEDEIGDYNDGDDDAGGDEDDEDDEVGGVGERERR